MAIIIDMPKLSDTMEEGAIASWHKQPGDLVKEGDILAEIETDKATMEYESPEKGYLLKILVEAGSSCELNAPIAVLGEKGETFDPSMLEQSGSQASQGVEGADSTSKSAAESSESPASSKSPESSESPASSTEKAEGKVAAAGKNEESSSSASAGNGEGSGRIKSSPLARKLASDLGVNLEAVQGSGPGGRIIQRDVESAQGQQAAAAATGATTGSQASSSSSSAQAGGQHGEHKPLSMMRKTIAKRLLAAKNEAPHFYLTASVDMAAALDWRQHLNKDFTPESGRSKISVNDLITLAVAKALRQHPQVNASWQGDAIFEHHDVHVAVAVALPTGLVTPVLRHTDRMGVRDISSQTKSLAKQAKAGELSNDAYLGGTFTISNLGMFGIDEFTAIINPPQAAILAIGQTQKLPWVDDNGRVTVASRMKVTMSCDHRVIDGAVGAQFLQTFAAYLENPLSMLE